MLWVSEGICRISYKNAHQKTNEAVWIHFVARFNILLQLYLLNFISHLWVLSKWLSNMFLVFFFSFFCNSMPCKNINGQHKWKITITIVFCKKFGVAKIVKWDLASQYWKNRSHFAIALRLIQTLCIPPGIWGKVVFRTEEHLNWLALCHYVAIALDLG